MSHVGVQTDSGSAISIRAAMFAQSEGGTAGGSPHGRFFWVSPGHVTGTTYFHGQDIVAWLAHSQLQRKSGNRIWLCAQGGKTMDFDEQVAISNSDKIMSLLHLKHFSCFPLHLKPHSFKACITPALPIDPQELPLPRTSSAPAWGACVQCRFSFDIPTFFMASDLWNVVGSL